MGGGAASPPTLRGHVASTSVSPRPVDDGQRRARVRSGPSSPTRRSSWSGATPGRRTRSARDVGELCGIDPLGVTATDDVDALLALQPDCVVYNPMWSDIDELVRILEAGVERRAAPRRSSPATTSAAAATASPTACEQGGSTMFGAGMSPGFVELSASRRRASATASTRSRSARRPTPRSTTRRPPRSGRLRRTDRRPDLQRMTAEGTAVFGEAVRMVADALGVELDEVRLRGRVRPDHRRTRSRLVDDQGGLRGRRRRQLAGPRRRPRSSSNSPCGGARARRSNPTGRSAPTAGSSRSTDARP